MGQAPEGYTNMLGYQQHLNTDFDFVVQGQLPLRVCAHTLGMTE
jgi:hypothetical protein